MPSTPKRRKRVGKKVFRLKCAVKNYDWGKIGKESEVAKLLQSGDEEFKLEEDAHYAELWMGTHPAGPSTAVFSNGDHVPLADWIAKHREKALGVKVNDYFNGELPFLFKVLSVNTSLSIQAHPNKIHAELLHKEHPDMYLDSNHKPEIAIALTEFKGLCGFRPIKEVSEFLTNLCELRNAVGNDHAMKLLTASHTYDMPLQREAMKDCFNGLMSRDQATIKQELKLLVERVAEMKSKDEDIRPYLGDVLLKLHSEFPGDIGCFSVYFLNLMILKPGQAMFLEANLPHAYLSGDCMECMSCSDNVVRAGLTPKHIDKHTLVEMLNYTGEPPSRRLFPPMKTTDPCITIMDPPVNEICVEIIQVPPAQKMIDLSAVDSASVCIIISGEASIQNRTLKSPLNMRRGSIIFISANESVSLNITSNGFHAFRSYCSMRY